MFVLFAALFVAADATETYEVNCWEAAVWDTDGDGYADDSATSSDYAEGVETVYADRATCPAGYVKLRGDCDDTDPDAHPRRWEIAGNGIDDDWNGTVDDANFYYLRTGTGVTDDSFGLYVRFADSGEAASAWNSPFASLSYEITYQALEDTGTDHTTGVLPVDDFWDGFGVQTTLLTLDDLDDGTVYRAKVQFYRTVRLFRPGGGIRTTHTAIGAESAWYYSMTSSNRTTYDVRTPMVNRAFYERYQNEHESVGYLGYAKDGTKYGADEGEAWCSEWYSWVADLYLDGMGHQASWSRLMDWFDGHGNLVTVDASNEVLVEWLGQPGDYLAEDTTGDGTTNHSAMLLAYDSHQDRLITIDGNASGRIDWTTPTRAGGNEVSLRTQRTSVVDGWGWIDTGMIP
jgi:hypothetical protein